MPYYLVKDFERGLDARRMIETTEAGSLIKAKNCVITRGGEIEKRKAFLPDAALPDNTYGLYAEDIEGGSFHVWGSAAPPVMPDPRVQYHQLVHPDGHDMNWINCVRYFNRKFFVIAHFVNGDSLAYYDGVLVTDDPPPTDEPPTDPEVPEPDPYPISQGRATTSFELWKNNQEASTINAIRAVKITGAGVPPTYDSHPVIDPATTIPILADEGAGSICDKIVAAVNGYAGTPKFHAKRDGRRVYISFAEKNADHNGYFLTVGVAANKTVYIDPKPPTFSGGESSTGAAPNIPIPQSNPSGIYTPGIYALQHKYKMYAAGGQTGKLNISALNNPQYWAEGVTGAGFIDFTKTGGRHTANPVSLAVFQDKLAIFAGKAVHIWRMDADLVASSEVGILHNTGTFAARSVEEFGNTDVFYLDQNGVRSLQSRELTGEAFSSDVGNPIDEIVRQQYRDMGNFFWLSISVVDPEDGRFILAMANRLFVFSFFSKTKISAWTEWDVDFLIEDMVTDSARVYVRDRNTIYSYGDRDHTAEQYDSTEVEVQLPYLNAGKPAHHKDIFGVDVALENKWKVEFGLDYSDPSRLETVGHLDSTTYRQQRIPVQAYGTHVSFKLTCSEPGYARIGNLAFHYREGEEPG